MTAIKKNSVNAGEDAKEDEPLYIDNRNIN
jgi:hypothetical protein